MGRFDNIEDQIKLIDIDEKVKWESNPSVKSSVIEEQVIYFWIRLYIKDIDNSIEIGDDIVMRYEPLDEEINTKFIAFGKSGLQKNHDDEITSFNPEDDKKVLCLAIDEKIVNTSTDIPFIRTLFKNSRYYEYQMVKRDELLFINKKNDKILDYYDCDY